MTPKNNEINVVEVSLRFPPELLEAKSSTTSASFVKDWLSPPFCDNKKGVVSFRGGIPGGINTPAGLIAVITFQAKAPGFALLFFQEPSRAFRRDGQGTPLLASFGKGLYQITAAPEESPSASLPASTDGQLKAGINSEPPLPLTAQTKDFALSWPLIYFFIFSAGAFYLIFYFSKRGKLGFKKS